MVGNHVDPPFHLLICLIQSDDIGRNGGGMVFLVRREPSGKNAQNSSVFLQGCFNSRLIVKLHIYLIEASNSETTWLRCGSGTFLSDAGAAGVRKGINLLKPITSQVTLTSPHGRRLIPAPSEAGKGTFLLLASVLLPKASCIRL